MTIEIARGTFRYQYKINEYCRTELLQRDNKAYARWYVHSRHRTEEEATAALLKVESEAREGSES